MEQWWLGYCKCLLIGELKEAHDIKQLDQHTHSVIKLIKKTRDDVNEKEETWIRLIISSYNHLSKQQLIRAISKRLVVPVRSAIVSDIIGYLSSVEGDLKNLSRAKRNPILLILDKVS